MKLENFPPRNHDAQKKEIENIKNIQKERFESKDKYILDDSEFIENYNNALKSPNDATLCQLNPFGRVIVSLPLAGTGLKLIPLKPLKKIVAFAGPIVAAINAPEPKAN